MFKVRFHLAAGENHRKWQITNTTTGEVEYHCPDDVHLIMRGCRLRNQRAAAEKIYAGANKQVCAWVSCREVAVIPAERDTYAPRAVLLAHGQPANPELVYVREHVYNPRQRPNWHSVPWGSGCNMDNHTFGFGYTVGRSVLELATRAEAGAA